MRYHKVITALGLSACLISSQVLMAAAEDQQTVQQEVAVEAPAPEPAPAPAPAPEPEPEPEPLPPLDNNYDDIRHYDYLLDGASNTL